MDELKRLREPVEAYLADRSIDEARLDTARTVANAILDEHQATAEGDKSAARAALRLAVKLDPDNSYVGFLDRKLRE